MTSDGGTARAESSREPLAAAEEDLARVRRVLESAAHGEAGGEELRSVVQGYLDEHGAALRGAASALGEETRRQTLEELYKWRAQLTAQLKPRKDAD
jgi:hypothetical protein